MSLNKELNQRQAWREDPMRTHEETMYKSRKEAQEKPSLPTPLLPPIFSFCNCEKMHLYWSVYYIKAGQLNKQS